MHAHAEATSCWSSQNSIRKCPSQFPSQGYDALLLAGIHNMTYNTAIVCDNGAGFMKVGHQNSINVAPGY
jgi:hypothetical protein